MNTKKSARILKSVFVMILAVCMTVGMFLPAAAAEMDAVRDVSTGVMKFNWLVDGEEYSRGSCFLINSTHVVTAYHCTMLSEAELDAMGIVGQDKIDFKAHMTYSVTVNRDVSLGATLIAASEDMDFAIFELDRAVKDRAILNLRTDKIKAADAVYSIGFPANADATKPITTTYTNEDIVIKEGVVSQAQTTHTYMTTDGFIFEGEALVTSCVLFGGDSGGPMVDKNGDVVGVSVAGADYYYASAISQVISVLDMYDISWTAAGETPAPETQAPAGDDTSVVAPETNDAPAVEVNKDALEDVIDEAGDVKEDDYTEDSYKELKDAVKKAEDILDDDNATQKEVDKAAKAVTKAIKNLEKAEEEEEEGGNMMMFIIIGAIAAVIVVVVVVIAVASKSKKAAPAQAPAAAAPAQAPVYAAPAARPAAPVQAPTYSAPAADAGETTVLSQGAGETTVLSQAANGGYLVRERNNERVQISSSDFTIGRERSKVSYCVSDNSSISRVHARFVVRGGNTYIVDNKAANGTFVNGVKLREGNETELKDGDKISLADEKFTFKK